jgi:hypothetical protein
MDGSIQRQKHFDFAIAEMVGNTLLVAGSGIESEPLWPDTFDIQQSTIRGVNSARILFLNHASPFL